MDLGECQKHHDLALRADYERAIRSNNADYGYDLEALEHLRQFIADCDRRTDIAKRRLAEQQADMTLEQAEKINKIHEFSEKIGRVLAESEAAGSAGEVEKSMELLKQVEELKQQKKQAEEDYRNTTPASAFQQQKLRVCEICSAYLGLYDNDRRLADHFGGKLHLGFIQIREHLEDLKLSIASKRGSTRRSEDAPSGALHTSGSQRGGGGVNYMIPREAEYSRPRGDSSYAAEGGEDDDRRRRRRSRSRERRRSRESSRERSHNSSSKSSRKHSRRDRSKEKKRRRGDEKEKKSRKSRSRSPGRGRNSSSD